MKSSKHQQQIKKVYSLHSKIVRFIQDALVQYQSNLKYYSQFLIVNLSNSLHAGTEQLVRNLQQKLYCIFNIERGLLQQKGKLQGRTINKYVQIQFYHDKIESRIKEQMKQKKDNMQLTLNECLSNIDRFGNKLISEFYIDIQIQDRKQNSTLQSAREQPFTSEDIHLTLDQTKIICRICLKQVDRSSQRIYCQQCLQVFGRKLRQCSNCKQLTIFKYDNCRQCDFKSE